MVVFFVESNGNGNHGFIYVLYTRTHSNRSPII